MPSRAIAARLIGSSRGAQKGYCQIKQTVFLSLFDIGRARPVPTRSTASSYAKWRVLCPACLLNRRAGHIAVGAEDAAITLFRFEQRSAASAFVDVSASVGGHCLRGSMSTKRAGKGRDDLCHGDCPSLSNRMRQSWIIPSFPLLPEAGERQSRLLSSQDRCILNPVATTGSRGSRGHA